ncbi:hypothetical protein ACFQ1M_16420 [Sungkyunkwania multivorans]|uniref:DUF998 domain-containing protein n=1 Tax=Sungkyunkwania multivorans TaxID=1173618 RepID=A0ABW3D2W4_9FLAO
MLLPIFGMVIFVLLYFFAAMLYPGGSDAFPNKPGFSFIHNYLCDLLDVQAINGELNTSRALAIVALGILCTSLILLWFYLPVIFTTKSVNQKITLVTGVASLGMTVFLSSVNHDLILRIAGSFGVITLLSVLIELFKIRFFKLFGWGVFCLFIFLGNYYVYETGSLIRALPLIQKVTFLSFIGWFVVLNLVVYRKYRARLQDRRIRWH